jgi:hypothetical protein
MSMSGSSEVPGVSVGRRVLVECDEPTIQDGMERVLRERGYAVAVCAGPTSRNSGRCPLVVEGHCGLVEDAHVVLHALDPADSANRDVLAALVGSCPGTPIVIELSDATDDMIDLGSGEVRQVRFPMDRATLVDAVERAASGAGSVSLGES